MIKRQMSDKIKYLAAKFPVVAVIGPRQSGKTTLVKNMFPEKNYVSLEDPDTREFALVDPRGFLAAYPEGAVLDEVQRAPHLFSYLQTIVDEKGQAGFFVLTGSHNFLLYENLSQTLAGRVAILKLLPFSLVELRMVNYPMESYERYLFKGFYPRIYDKDIEPVDWYPSYIQTYIERDVRLIKNISDLNAFQRFLRLCAGRTGQILNLSSLGNDCGITHNTAKSWLSILEASYIVFLLQPHYANFNKRLVKSAKLYFYDPGLVCSLLGIENEQQLFTHYLKGGLFESFVISELIKHRLNQGLEPNCYYWRDSRGNEIDCLLETGGLLTPVEIKAGKTITPDYFTALQYWRKLAGEKARKSFVVYGGDGGQKRTQGNVVSWKDTTTIIDA